MRVIYFADFSRLKRLPSFFVGRKLLTLPPFGQHTVRPLAAATAALKEHIKSTERWSMYARHVVPSERKRGGLVVSARENKSKVRPLPSIQRQQIGRQRMLLKTCWGFRRLS